MTSWHSFFSTWHVCILSFCQKNPPPPAQKIVLPHKLTTLMAVIRDSKQKQQRGRKKKNSIKKLSQPTALHSHSVCLCVYVCACLCLVGIYDFSVLVLGFSTAPNNTVAGGVKAVSVDPLII